MDEIKNPAQFRLTTNRRFECILHFLYSGWLDPRLATPLPRDS